MARLETRNNPQKTDQTRLGALVQRVGRVEQWLDHEGKQAPTSDLARIWSERIRPFWKLYPGIYAKLSTLLLKRGDNFLASEVAGEGIERIPPDPQILYNRALALARIGARAQARRLLDENWELVSQLGDARPLIGRLYKDSWKATGRRSDLEQSRNEYAAASTEDRSDVYYPAVNAATLSALLDDTKAAARFSKLVRDDLASHGGPSNYWEHASLAEALLAADDLAAAREAYRSAAASNPSRDMLLTTREQAVILLDKHGLPQDALDDILGKPLVVCITGHVIDRPDRPEPRFPTDREPSVRQRIDAFIGKLDPWNGFGAAAGGSDLIFMEAIGAAGIDTSIVLPLSQDQFAESSVIGSGEGWKARFENALSHADSVWESPQLETPSSGALWQFANQLILGAAQQKARAWRGDLVILAVWDGKTGDGLGGTSDLVQAALASGLEVWQIDPRSDRLATRISATPAARTVQLEYSLHVSLPDRKTAAAFRNNPRIVKATAGATHVVELEGEFRAVFDNPRDVVELLHAIAPLDKSGHLGVGIAAGPKPEKASSPAFHLSQSAQLAHVSRTSNSILAAGEFVALTANTDLAPLEFEYVGRRELSPGIETPVYAATGLDQNHHRTSDD